MPDDTNDGQPSLEKLTREGISPRKCIASGEEYGSGGGKAAAPKSGARAKPALAGLRMKGGSGY